MLGNFARVFFLLLPMSAYLADDELSAVSNNIYSLSSQQYEQISHKKSKSSFDHEKKDRYI